MLYSKKFFFSFIVVIAICMSSSVIASSKIDNIELSVAGGINKLSTHNTTLVVSPYETDSVLVNSINNAAIWKIGIGRAFFEDALHERNFLNHLLVELNLYRSSSHIKGNIWQYELSQFNNYSFDAPITTTRIMLDLKPSFFTWKNISLYPILGLGLAINTVSYKETVTGEDIDPSNAASLNSKQNNSMAYDLGLGARIDFNAKWSAFVEYINCYMNAVTASNSTYPNARVTNGPQFTIQSQSFLFGLSLNI